MVEMAEDPALLITKWTLQRWKLCPFSLLKDKTAQLKIAAYLTGLFVFLYRALTLKFVCQITENVTESLMDYCCCCCRFISPLPFL